MCSTGSATCVDFDLFKVDDLDSLKGGGVIQKLSTEDKLVVKVTSDHHMGMPDDGANDFHITDAQFVKWMNESLTNGTSAIILLGDILEFWELQYKSQPTRELYDNFRISRPALFSYLDNHLNKDIFYVLGNHDYNMLEYIGAPLGLYLEGAGQKVFFTHGHYTDEKLHGTPGQIESAYYRASAERLLHGNAEEYLKELKGETGRNGDHLGYRDSAEELITRYQLTQVVFGHTHVQETYGNYVNSGGGEYIVSDGNIQVTTLIIPANGSNIVSSQETIKIGEGDNHLPLAFYLAVIGGGVALCIVLIVVACCCCCKKDSKEDELSPSNVEMNVQANR
eukprot:TRINITY_DN5919_c0_g1_i1.p1 TRINITY_DN5919_c0_g1~~TRINITY_DN5919_c0_g1_i1.p1  ORF type:complete len:337 (+),score=38.81 TRINITY_DN5919_c0_g1_i1:54-1064(+)